MHRQDEAWGKGVEALTGGVKQTSPGWAGRGHGGAARPLQAGRAWGVGVGGRGGAGACAPAALQAALVTSLVCRRQSTRGAGTAERVVH